MRLMASLRRAPGSGQFTVTMLDLAARTARARRISRQSSQVRGQVIGMPDMTVGTDVTHIARLVEYQGPKAQPVIEDAGFNLKAQRRRRLHCFHEHGGGQMLKAPR